MGALSCLLSALILAAQPAPASTGGAPEAGEVAEEPEGGAGVSPIEIVPRIELRQSNLRLTGGVAVHDLTAEIDVQFLRRVVLQYQVPYRTLVTPSGPISGTGDVQMAALGILSASPYRLVGLLLGTILDTATQPPLGAGKQQLTFGAAGAVKPRRAWIAYALVQEQLSVGGSSARADINQAEGRLGSVVFGKQYNWVKVDLDTVVDFAGDAGRVFGTLEVGSLLIGRVGMFVRAGTQLIGPRQLQFSLTGGLRYLFRLDEARKR